MDSEMSNSFDAEEDKAKVVNQKGDSSLVLDLSPTKFEKPKDHLFFDFFSVYTENFI